VQVQVTFLFGGQSPDLGRTVSIFNVDVFRSLVLVMAWIGNNGKPSLTNSENRRKTDVGRCCSEMDVNRSGYSAQFVLRIKNCQFTTRGAVGADRFLREGRLLTRGGASQDGDTPLANATAKGHTAVVRVLQAAGATK